MLLRHWVLALAVSVTVLFLITMVLALIGVNLDQDGNLLGAIRMITAVAWVGWIGVTVRDSIIDHLHAMERVRARR